MSHRAVPTYSGTPTLTPAIIEDLKEALAEAMGNEDVATESDLEAFYAGQAGALEYALDLLYGVPLPPRADREPEKPEREVPPLMDLRGCGCTAHETCDACIDSGRLD